MHNKNSKVGKGHWREPKLPFVFWPAKLRPTSQRSRKRRIGHANSSFGSPEPVVSPEKVDHPSLRQVTGALPEAASPSEGLGQPETSGAVQDEASAWNDVPERRRTRETKYEEVLDIARKVDRAAARAKDRFEQESYPLIAAAADFLEMFDVRPFELDIGALDQFLDSKNVPPLHGNAATPLRRVIELFKNEETDTSLIGKRAATLAGLRLAKVPASDVPVALSTRGERRNGTKDGMGKYVAILRRFRQEQKRSAQDGETPAADPETTTVEVEHGNRVNPRLVQIREWIAHGLLRVRVNGRDLPDIDVQLDGSGVLLTAGASNI